MLEPPEKLQKLRAALHAKAKASPDQRFHALYDKVHRADVLAHAYACCRANGGAEGVDGQTFADIESYGAARWLDALAQELRGKTYRPTAVRRVWIPKPGDPSGKKRPLGIPTIKDRVAQTAALMVMEPIFEADLQPEQHAYRSDRSALDAVREVGRLLNHGYTQVVDADLSGYFDSIPHADLMRSLARRIVDGSMLHLLKMWLEAPVEETDERGNRQRTTRNKDDGKGTPQGAPISPLLANVYMRRFVLGWKTLGHQRRLQARIVNYADDFVICCKGTAHQAAAVMRSMTSKLKLTVNEGKTHVRQVPDETFDFLGYTFGRQRSARTGKVFLGGRPSDKRIARVCEKISAMTARRGLCLDVAQLVAELNRVLRGWAGYFCLGPVSRAYRKINSHVRFRFRQWWGAKHKQRPRQPQWFWSPWLEETFGLLQLRWDPKRLPRAGANAMPHATA
jgi:group II intron reverse transcriptase/maturase